MCVLLFWVLFLFMVSFLLGGLHSQAETRSLGFQVYDLSFRYLYISLETLALLWYVWQIRKEESSWFSQWVFEERWTFVFLIVGILFNNPFFVGEITRATAGFEFLDSIFAVLFIAYLLLYVLLITDSQLTKKVVVTPHPPQGPASFFGDLHGDIEGSLGT